MARSPIVSHVSHAQSDILSLFYRVVLHLLYLARSDSRGRGNRRRVEVIVSACDTSSNMNVHFLAEGEQQPSDIAALLADFIRGARRSLDIAIYETN